MNDRNRWLLHLLFPNRCCLCGAVIRWREHLCDACRDTAPFVLPPICPDCGRGEDRCTCRHQRHAFARCVAPLYYEGRGRGGIGRLKNTGDIPTVEGLAEEMQELIRREYGGIRFDLMTAVPLHPTDKRRREYNPAERLAQALKERTGIPYAPVLHKLFRTAPQKELPAGQRRGNLLGVFDVSDPAAVSGKTVLLVDDVMTTGATLDECAKMLKIAGAAEVYAITAAVAVMHSGEKIAQDNAQGKGEKT